MCCRPFAVNLSPDKRAPTEGGFFTIYQTIYAPFLRFLEKIPFEYAGHTPQFQSLVYHLLQWTWERGLFPDMTEDEIGLIATLSAYHDVGKSMLPPTLLYKEGPLTPKEFETLKTHPEWGEFLVDLAIPELRGTTTHRYACEICRWHHERWDGSGYPDGLRGTEIPRYVQVVALADAYDALVAPRSYKPPIRHRRAANMICSGACGAFWPPLMTVFAERASSIQQEVYGEKPDPPEQ